MLSSGSVSANDKAKEDRYHPDFKYDDAACKYIGEWGDCDPFKMVRLKEQRLISGSATCDERKNLTKPCSRNDFPPGTVWLLNEHKLCVQELQKLKTMIDDLHRYIDLIHQRGQALFNAYNDLRKHLNDIRQEISIIGRKNHDAEQTIKRLRVELEDWKSKNNKIQEELNQVKAEYKEMERKVRESKEMNQELVMQKEGLVQQQESLQQRLEQLLAENKGLKISLLDSERYKEEFRELNEIVAGLKRRYKELEEAIKQAKADLNAARLEGVMPKTKHLAPKFNKDTKVNLDMSMWIVHNISKEEREPYKPEMKLYMPQEEYEPPKYEAPSYEPPKYEAPSYEPPKYEAPSYEPPKYEEPSYEPPKYEEPSYELPKYKEPSYEPPKYEEQIAEEENYEPPKYEEPSPEEPKYIDVPKYEQPEPDAEKY